MFGRERNEMFRMFPEMDDKFAENVTCSSQGASPELTPACRRKQSAEDVPIHLAHTMPTNGDNKSGEKSDYRFECRSIFGPVRDSQLRANQRSKRGLDRRSMIKSNCRQWCFNKYHGDCHDLNPYLVFDVPLGDIVVISAQDGVMSLSIKILRWFKLRHPYHHTRELISVANVAPSEI